MGTRAGHWEILGGIRTWVRRCTCGGMQYWSGPQSRHDSGGWITHSRGNANCRHRRR
jgi:hypothetical protein